MVNSTDVLYGGDVLVIADVGRLVVEVVSKEVFSLVRALLTASTVLRAFLVSIRGAVIAAGVVVFRDVIFANVVRRVVSFLLKPLVVIGIEVVVMSGFRVEVVGTTVAVVVMCGLDEVDFGVIFELEYTWLDVVATIFGIVVCAEGTLVD